MGRALRTLGVVLFFLGLAGAGLAALGGPFGPLKDLRHPLLLAAVGYGLAASARREWWGRERFTAFLRHPRFALGLMVIASFVFVRIKLLEWWAGRISGVDFSHLDYAAWSTAAGSFMQIPILAQHPTFLDMFGNHYSPILLIFALARWVWDSPVGSLVVHALSLSLPIPLLHRLARHSLPAEEASLLTLVYVFCGSVASTLQFDIHHEAFYVLGFTLLFLGYYEKLVWIFAGTLLTLTIKEDAGLYLGFAFLIFSALQKKRRYLYLGLAGTCVVAALITVKVLMRWHQPEVLHTPAFYFSFWQRYGSSYGEVFRTMLTHPHWVLGDLVLNPGLYKQLLPWAFLPFASPLALIALAPALVLSTASSMQRGFGLYYGIVLVPIFYAASAEALKRVARASRRRGLLLAMLALSAFVGGAYLRFPAPNAEFAVWRKVPAMIAPYVGPRETVWVQSGILPYLDYGVRWRRIENLSTLPDAGSGPVVYFDGLGVDSIEVSSSRIPERMLAKGYRLIFREGNLSLYR